MTPSSTIPTQPPVPPISSLSAPSPSPSPSSSRSSSPPAGARRFAVPLPRDYRGVAEADVWTVIAALGALVAVLWARHALERDVLTDLGEVTALAGTYASLVGILFAARAPWLDQVLGPDRLRESHRVLGFVAVWGVVVHAVLSTVATAGSLGDTIPNLVALLTGVPGMVGALVGTVLLVLVAVSSMAAARRRLPYETWHGLHLYVYLAMAFGFLHQLTVGADFADDTLAASVWVLLYLAAFGPLLVHRVVWPLALTLRHRPRIARIEPEGEGVFSLYVEGRRLGDLAVRSGQFFIVRALTLRDWWHAHPFSISAAPNGQALRFTVKEYGAGTRALRGIRPGTPVLLEGPYGAMHGARWTGRRLLLIAGGIGVAPLRALAEALPYQPWTADLIYRVPDPADLPFRAELDAIAQRRGLRLHVVAGRRGTPGVGTDPLGPWELQAMVPDAADRDVYLCGPNDLMDRVRASLLALGASPDRIQMERFW